MKYLKVKTEKTGVEQKYYAVPNVFCAEMKVRTAQ